MHDEMNGALVIVAHARDEVLSFSSVLRGAHVVALTADRTPDASFEGACRAFGASRVTRLHLEHKAGARIPAELLARELEKLDAGARAHRVFTHDPLDTNVHHRDVAVAVARRFDEVWVAAPSGLPELVNVLDEHAFRAKLEALNRWYAPHEPHPTHPDDRRPDRPETAPPPCELSARAVTGVEAFAGASFAELARAASLTHWDVVLDETPDTWAFAASPYERERFDGTISLLAEAGRAAPPATVLELGACEGLMTERIRALFPAAKIAAVEPAPEFARRLRARLAGDRALEIIERPLEEIPLEAELVVACEVLYYVAARVPQIAAKIRAKHLVTSYHGAFDDRLSETLRALGWREVKHLSLPMRFERSAGARGAFVVRRVGCVLRLWGRE